MIVHPGCWLMWLWKVQFFILRWSSKRWSVTRGNWAGKDYKVKLNLKMKMTRERRPVITERRTHPKPSLLLVVWGDPNLTLTVVSWFVSSMRSMHFWNSGEAYFQEPVVQYVHDGCKCVDLLKKTTFWGLSSVYSFLLFFSSLKIT